MTTTLADVTALVLAGGLGTRLRGVLPDRPKVLAPVAGRPFLAHLLDHLARAGVRRAVLCTGHLAGQLEEAFGPRYAGVELTYSREDEPLGTGGALRLAASRAGSELFLAMNGDSYVDCPADEFFAWHRRSPFAASILLTRVPDAGRFGTVETDAGRVVAFREKRGLAEPGWINAGVYLLPRPLLEALPAGRAVSLEREAFPAWVSAGLGGYAREAAFLDIGTPESFAEADAFLGRVRPPGGA